ncbi:retrotransposon protein, putative, ty1-copia subclass [Tanacetum coccineum]
MQLCSSSHILLTLLHVGRSFYNKAGDGNILPRRSHFYCSVASDGSAVASDISAVTAGVEHELSSGLREMSSQVGKMGSCQSYPGALSLYMGNGQREVVEANLASKILSFYVSRLGRDCLNNCHYAPSITRGVISVFRLYKDGFINRFVNNTIQVSRNNMVYFSAIPRDGIFEIDLSNSYANDSSIYIVSNKRAKLNLDSALLWHCHLGHISKKCIKKLQHEGLLNSTDLRAFEKCISYHMYLYIDAEEHELRDLGKLANYKAAFGKLLPNGKTVRSMWLFKKKTDKDGAVHIYKAYLVAEGLYSNPKVLSIKIIHPSMAKLKRSISWAKQASRQWNKQFDTEINVTPPDVAFAQNITSRFQKNPGDLYWTTVKNILKYLRNTKDMFLVYRDDVDWESGKQSIFATLYREAKYIAAYDAFKEAVWVRKFISGLGVVPVIEEPITIHGEDGKIGKNIKATYPSIWLDIVHELEVIKKHGINVVNCIQKKLGNGVNTSFWEETWRGDVTFKTLYHRLYILETIKDVTIASKLSYSSLNSSFRRAPRGGVEQSQFLLMLAKVEPP